MTNEARDRLAEALIEVLDAVREVREAVARRAEVVKSASALPGVEDGA